MRTTIIYIAPNAGEVYHAQARIYRAEFEGKVNTEKIRDHYRENHRQYKEVGLMNYEGKLVCFEGTDEQRQDLKDCEPLMAGLVFAYQEGA